MMAEQMMQNKAGEMAAKQTIPAGYKQTEVGIIPNDWGVKCLGELVEISSGESPSKFTFNLSGIPYFKVEQLNNGLVYAESTPYFIDSRKKITSGSLIFPKRGASILLNKIRVLKYDSYMDTNLMTLTCSSELNEFYLYNQLIYKELSSVADTTSIPQINNKHIVPYTIPYPAKAEQIAIATVLSDSDALIVGLEQLIAKKQAIKTAAMQQLLTGRTRLPAFALRPDGTPKGYKSSELGQIPEDWAVAAVSDVLSEISMGPFGSDIKVSNFVKSGVPVLNGINVSASKLVDSFSNFVTHEKAKELNKAVASRGDVVVTHRGTIGQISYIPDDSLFDRYVISQSQFRARFNNQVLPVWVVLFFLSPAGSARLLEGKGHTGVPAIAQATTTFRKLKFSLPSLEEQTAIATILSDMDSELTALEQKLAKARDVKQGMMQQFLPGRTRLPLPKEA